MNPYQDVIDWLRSPEGEKWSEDRMKEARYAGENGLGCPAYWASPVHFGAMFPEGLIGVFSLKGQ